MVVTFSTPIPRKIPVSLTVLGFLTAQLRTFFALLILSLSFLPSVSLSSTESTSISTEETISEILPADKAFQVQATTYSQGIKLQITVAPGYSLYPKHFVFNTLLKTNNKPVPMQVSLPPATLKNDPVLGDYPVYRGKIAFEIPFSTETQKTADLLVAYQGCSDDGFCYAPEAKQIHVHQTGEGPAQILITNVDPETLISTPPTQESATGIPESPPTSESDRLTQLLYTQTPAITLCLFFGLGILLAFTPCVLPMIPILANILIGKDKPLATSRAIFLASLYILSVASCYGLAGVIAGFAGQHWQAALQQPPFLIAFSILLMLFALSQFNLFHLRLPVFVSNVFSHLPQIKFEQKQGSALGAVTMGIMSALVASPCVTPALVGALTYISQTGNALLGGLALFMMSLGMGLPLLSVACVGNRFLPKTGAWMGRIKIVTGLFLLVLAGSILWRAIPTQTTEFVSIETPEQLTVVLENAKKLKKPVILDVYAQWCVSCKRMDNAIFDAQQTKRLNAEFHLLRLDITKLGKGHKQLLTELGIVGPPTVIFFDMKGQELKNLRLVGEINKPDFLNHMDRFKQSLSLPEAR